MRALVAQWNDVNATHFRGLLRHPIFELVSGNSSKLGVWIGETRTLQISEALVSSQPWSVVAEVLKHEMAHQYVEEILGVRNESAHGPSYQAVCRDMGIDGAATGMPGPGKDADPVTAKIVERIHRLLALAGSPNEHEAEAAMSAARKLMLKHNLDRIAERGAEGYVFDVVGQPARRVHGWLRGLASLLGDHFFVEVIWVQCFVPAKGVWAQQLEVTGTTANVEMAKYVHAYLSRTAEGLWVEHKKALGVRGDKDRLQYLAGVIRGFSEKLGDRQKAERKEGLIWIGDPNLDDYYHRRYPRVRTVTTGGARLTEAYAHGKAAGREIVISKPVGASQPARGFALPAKASRS
ncbi:MAG: DUF2786 domain-containing protein [Deltaproteobacteria bacterium]|nr:DUF2786 domain-containing protein [Deltaproteobacteria bacterium]